MGFFTPWFLAAGLAVGLPVWLHLLRKHKTTPLPFSSLMFFEKRTQSSIKHRRLRYLLLFAARALLVLLLVLAFAQPYVRQTVLASKRSGEVTVLAIDNSLSMRAGTRLSQAKSAAKSVIGGLRVGQRAQVLAFGSRVQVMSEVTDDHSSLNAAVDSIEAGDTRTSYAELSRSLRSIAQSLKLPLAVELYSDMQQTGWPANFNDLRLNATVQLNPHAIEARELHRGECGGAPPCVRRQEGARPRHGRGLRQQEVHAQRLARTQRPRAGDQTGGGARERPRHRRIPVPRCPLRPQ
jgi:hypothetical protein